MSKENLIIEKDKKLTKLNIQMQELFRIRGGIQMREGINSPKYNKINNDITTIREKIKQIEKDYNKLIYNK